LIIYFANCSKLAQFTVSIRTGAIQEYLVSCMVVVAVFFCFVFFLCYLFRLQSGKKGKIATPRQGATFPSPQNFVEPHMKREALHNNEPR
jgi:hypothetical protein